MSNIKLVKPKADQNLLLIPGTLYKTLSLLLSINKYTGLMPLSFNRQGNIYIVEWSWKILFWGIVVLICFTFGSLFGLALSYQIGDVYEIRFQRISSKVVTIAELGTCYLGYLVGYVFVSKNHQHFLKYLENCNNVDSIVGIPKYTWKIPTTIFLTFAFTFFCLGADIYQWSVVTIKFTGTFDFITQFVPFYYTYVFLMIINLNFWMLVYLIYLRLEKLKSFILNYLHEAKVKQTNVFSVRSVLEFSENKNKIKKDIITSDTIRKFVAAYDFISESCININYCYGIAILFVLINVISDLIVTPFVLYNQLSEDTRPSWVYTQSFWMLCHILRLFFIIEPCHYCHQEVKEIRKLVVKMRNLQLGKDIEKELRLFKNILDENPIKYTVANFSVLGRNLVPTICASALTYLVVLFQSKS